ncbi:hypothetical protein KDD93_00535 [Campylobacter sp. faydin G-24]|uniref:Periplasmic protein n=1 Tax=Campylobacter anatolicus TaxID=2829105 RepID=A0ABS5HFL7_9BACT|nr:hypothetical protein [Campylobacter anatolicus]MBR8462507.1 hypothetical protein [Campylobacter anatolicus]MBR8463061.1 hypothetical protein [Campylobacter anatolicus]MBR8465618.1 hypothetical protein [Campylobacter anatolicus]
MGRHTLLVIVVILFFALGVCGVFLYRYANSNLVQIYSTTESREQNTTQTKIDKQGGWISDLASIGKKDYTFATNEIFIEYNKHKKEIPIITAFELIIDKNDIYSVFCLMQTLRNSQVDFSVIKDSTKSQIFLNTQDSELLQRIILQLRTYDIHSSVREVKI